LMQLCERSGEFTYAIDACERALKEKGWGRVAVDFAKLCKQADRVSYGIEVLWYVLFKSKKSGAQARLLIDDPRHVYSALMQLLAENHRIDDILMVAKEWAVRVPRAEYQSYDTSYYVCWRLVDIGKELLRKKAWNEALQLAEGALALEPSRVVAVRLEKLRDRSLQKLGRPPRIKRDTISQTVTTHEGEQLLQLTGVYKIGTSTCTDIILLGPQPRAIVTKAGKTPHVFLYDLMAGQQVWETKLAASSRVYALTGGGYLLMQFKGVLQKEDYISYAIHELLFLDSGGALVNRRAFQEPLDDIVITRQAILVGCRDGYLYALDPNGSERWHFRVPGRKRKEWTWPPFPYLVAANEDGDAILVNCWDKLYALSGEGRRQWLWRTPEGSLSLPHVIKVAPTGERYAVATRGNRIHILNHNGKLISSVTHGDRVIDLLVGGTDRKLAVVGDRRFVLYDDAKLVKETPLSETFRGIIALPDKPYLVCWGSYRLLLVDAEGEVCADIEFSKTIKKVSTVQGNLLIATAGVQVVTLAVT
jgi:hypothetical protein